MNDGALVNKALFFFDLSAIKSYVFATDRLREIRGASSLLDQLNRDWIPAAVREVDPSAEVVFAGGGAGMLVVGEAAVAGVAEAVRRTCRERTETIQAHSASVVIPNGGEAGPGERAAVGMSLRLAKGNNPPYITGPAHSLIAPCGTCGELYATATWREPGGGEELAVCRACWLKIERDRVLKAEIGRGSWPGVWGDLHAYANVRQIFAGKTRAENFDQLCAEGRPEGSLTVIYADGDGLGKLFREVETLDEVRLISAAVRDSLVDAVAEAAAGPLAGGGTVLPFDILLLGGDDLVIATTADRALPAALTLVRRFGEAATKRLGRSVSISAGVSVAHSHYPLHTLLGLAEGALRQAKRERFRRAGGRTGGGQPGMISYVVVGNASHTEFERYEGQELYQAASSGYPAVRRTLRPYDPAEIEQLFRLTRDAASLPGTRLEALRATAFMDRSQGTLEGRFVLSRMSSAQRKVADEVMSTLAAGREVDFPWIIDGDELLNPWADIQELIGLGVAGSRGGEDG